MSGGEVDDDDGNGFGRGGDADEQALSLVFA